MNFILLDGALLRALEALPFMLLIIILIISLIFGLFAKWVSDKEGEFIRIFFKSFFILLGFTILLVILFFQLPS